MRTKKIKASELQLTPAEKSGVVKQLAPIQQWENIAVPEQYLKDNVGRLVNGLEKMLEIAVLHQDYEFARILALDLIKMTPLGHSKADVTVNTANKLRNENDFSHVDTEKLMEILGRKVG